MSNKKFGSSQVLPLFHVISPYAKSTDVITKDKKTDMHQKHKRRIKKPEVPVHHSQTASNNNNVAIHKSLTTNFSSHKHKHRRDKDGHQIEDTSINNGIMEEIEDNNKIRIRRKHLMKENSRISLENEKLTEQLMLVQNTISKKESQIMKLKEKNLSLQMNSEELVKENNIIKTQYEDILINLEEFKNQLKFKIKCKSCESFKELIKEQANDLEITRKCNNDLKEDINMLKNVVYRLNVQLERYQQKWQQPNPKLTNHFNVIAEVEPSSNPSDNIITQNVELDHNDHLHTPVSWGNVNSHTLGPLLDAYQDTIKEKEDIIAKYEVEFVNFTKKLKNVIEENELLHKKSVQETENFQKNFTELESNRKELKILREQNDLLIKKCALKHDKLQEICKVYDHKIETMRRDYTVLQEQYHKTRFELNSLQGKYQSLTEVHDSLKSDTENLIPLSVHTASVNECRRLFEELKNQYDIEKNKFLNQIKLLEKQIEEMETKVVEVGTEKRELQVKVRSGEKHVRKIEQKLTESQNLLTHTQISRDACKRQLAKAIEFGRELVNEQESLLQQLSSRHKENKAVKKIGSSIVTRMDFLKTQLKTVQQDAFQQLASVEERINQQDSSMENMRRDHETEVEKLLQEIHDKDDYIARLIQQNNQTTPYVLYREKRMHLS